MRSKSVAFLLADLGVTKTHSRPHVSDDNPFSESHFRTPKYRPEFPDRFGCIQDSRAFCQGFFRWYNEEHRHSGLGLLAPAMVHYGQAESVVRQRQAVLDVAYHLHPERFVGSAPKPPALPHEVWINKPVPTPKTVASRRRQMKQRRPYAEHKAMTSAEAIRCWTAMYFGKGKGA